MIKRKWIMPTVLLTMVFILVLFFVPTALAGETRTGNTIEIAQGEVVADDLYVFANKVVVNGTIQGDLVSFSTNLVLGPTGVITGDLIAAGQSLEIEGVVQDDARVAGAVLTIGEGAMIGDDLMSAGFSLETASGSQVGGSLTFGGYQALLAGSVAGDVKFGGNSLDLEGSVGGNAEVDVGSAQANMPFNPFNFIPGMPAVPSVPAGLTLGDNASIGGALVYQAPQEATIPPGVVAGPVEYTQVTPVPKPSEGVKEVRRETDRKSVV